ncbi:hypothetical protein TOC8171_54900 [Pseudomonas syringae]
MDNQVVSVVVKSSTLEQQPYDNKSFAQPCTRDAQAHSEQPHRLHTLLECTTAPAR